MNAPVPHPLDCVLVSALEPAPLYAVGGRVRDELRDQLDGVFRPPKDLDYVVCGMEVDELIRRLQAVGRVDVVGASFAVVKFRCDAGAADIALPRREFSTGPAHRDFRVESGADIPLEDDLGRRDFRMNMIARAVDDGRIVDPFGGVRDIAARRIDIVADATFADDPLRLLRAAQFAGRLGFGVTPRTQEAMAASAELITTVAAERVADEMTKLLVLAPVPSSGIELLRETGILAYIFPELLEGVGVDQNAWHAYDVYRHSLVTMDAVRPGDLILRLAALLHDVGKPRTKDGPHFYSHERVGADLVPQMLSRLRFPNATIETVAHLVRQHMYSADPDLAPKAIRRFIQRIGSEHLERMFDVRAADIVGSGLPKRDDSNERFQARVFEVLAQAPAATVRDLAIGGRDVIALFEGAGAAEPGFNGDRRVGEVLRTLFERVTDDPALNDRAILLAAARDLIARAH